MWSVNSCRRLLSRALRGNTKIELPTSFTVFNFFILCNKWLPNLNFVLLRLILGKVFICSCICSWLSHHCFQLVSAPLVTAQQHCMRRQVGGTSSLYAFHHLFLIAFRRIRTAYWEASTLLMFLRLEEDTVVAWLRRGLAWQRNSCTVAWPTQGHCSKSVRHTATHNWIRHSCHLLDLTDPWPRWGDLSICLPRRLQYSQHHKTWEEGLWPGSHPSRHHPRTVWSKKIPTAILFWKAPTHIAGNFV